MLELSRVLQLSPGNERGRFVPLRASPGLLLPPLSSVRVASWLQLALLLQWLEHYCLQLQLGASS